MKLEQSFEVDAPAHEVWTLLLDVQKVARCLPGAEVTDASDEGTYSGTFKVKLGPATAVYAGTLHMESVDEEGRVATMRADGKDKRGQGSAKASIASRVQEQGGGARVEVETDLTITGRLARFGRTGMIEDISNRLMRDFASCLQQQFAPADAGAGSEPQAGPGTGEGDGGGESPAAKSPAAQPPAKPISGLRLFFGALLDRLRRLFGRRSS